MSCRSSPGSTLADVPTFTLGSLTLELYDSGDIDLGTPTVNFGVVSNPLSREPAQTMRTVTEFRRQTWPVRLAGVTSLDESKRENAVRQLHNLNVELRKATNTLVITRRGSAVETVYQVAGNEYAKAQLNKLADRGGVTFVLVTLTVRPWAEGATLTQTIATSLETPNVVDLTVPGEEPTPLTTEATRAFSGSGLQSLIVARIPVTFDLEDLLRLAMDASAPNWDLVTGSWGYHSGSDNLRLCTSEIWRAMYWPALPVGRYKLYLRCRVQPGGRGWLAQSRASNDPSAAPVALADDDWRFACLGDYASDGYTALRIVGKVREAANGLLVDWLFPVPLDYGSPLHFHCAASAVQRVTSMELDTTMQLTTGGTRSARRYVSGPGICVVGAARLAVLACDADGSLRRPGVTLSETHTPLYAHFVPTPEA